MCAMQGGRSVATTMGFTALDGLPMGRRCGSLDPGVVLYLMKEKDMDYETLSDLLYQRSGLLGISGISDDMRELLTSDTPEAKEAIELFVYRIARETGSLAAALGGLDILVFTGGIGEHAAAVRESVCQSLHWLGVRMNKSANDYGERRINATDSDVDIFVIPTDEDLMVARHTLSLLALSSKQRSVTADSG
jgi:acetate kinase